MGLRSLTLDFERFFKLINRAMWKNMVKKSKDHMWQKSLDDVCRRQAYHAQSQLYPLGIEAIA
jgi:hypothetical protein